MNNSCQGQNSSYVYLLNGKAKAFERARHKQLIEFPKKKSILMEIANERPGIMTATILSPLPQLLFISLTS